MRLIAHGAKAEQDYDPDPPRCRTCVYFRHEPEILKIERTLKRRGGKTKTVMVPARAHPSRNPLVMRCTFGNFKVSAQGICNEWRNHAGERVE
jgi:hypothetical protein